MGTRRYALILCTQDIPGVFSLGTKKLGKLLNRRKYFERVFQCTEHNRKADKAFLNWKSFLFYKSLALLAVRGKMDSIILKVANSNQYSIVGVLIRRWHLVSIISTGNLLLKFFSVLTAEFPVKRLNHYRSTSTCLLGALGQHLTSQQSQETWNFSEEVFLWDYVPWNSLKSLCSFIRWRQNCKSCYCICLCLFLKGRCIALESLTSV